MTSGWMVAYGYFSDFFTAWYSGDKYEQFVAMNRVIGPYAGEFWALMFCNILAPQFLWSRRERTHPIPLFIVAFIVNVGMWLERFVIVVTSLLRDFLPSSWGIYHGTRWDWAVFIGTIGLFLSLLFLFVRYLPAISITEMRQFAAKEGATE